jgi:hypothetical protein
MANFEKKYLKYKSKYDKLLQTGGAGGIHNVITDISSFADIEHPDGFTNVYRSLYADVLIIDIILIRVHPVYGEALLDILDHRYSPNVNNTLQIRKITGFENTRKMEGMFNEVHYIQQRPFQSTYICISDHNSDTQEFNNIYEMLSNYLSNYAFRDLIHTTNLFKQMVIYHYYGTDIRNFGTLFEKLDSQSTYIERRYDEYTMRRIADEAQPEVDAVHAHDAQPAVDAVQAHYEQPSSDASDAHRLDEAPHEAPPEATQQLAEAPPEAQPTDDSIELDESIKKYQRCEQIKSYYTIAIPTYKKILDELKQLNDQLQY